MTKNRRKSPRIRPRALVAHVTTHGHHLTCQVENVSAHGLFVRTDERHEAGEHLKLELVKPGWKKAIPLSATVTSCVPSGGRATPGLGLQLDPLDDERRLRFEELLAQLGLPREAPPPAPADAPLALAEEGGGTDLLLRPIAVGVDDLDPYALEASPTDGQLRPAQQPLPNLARGGPFDLSLAPPKPAPPMLTPKPTPAVAPAPSAPSQDTARLTLQIRGLLIELDAAKTQVSERDAEIARLKELLAKTLGTPL